MTDWLRRYADSRRARNWTLGSIGLLTVAMSGGMLLANFTLAGVNPYYLSAHASQTAARDDDGLVRDIAMRLPDPALGWRDDIGPPAQAEYRDASY